MQGHSWLKSRRRTIDEWNTNKKGTTDYSAVPARRKDGVMPNKESFDTKCCSYYNLTLFSSTLFHSCFQYVILPIGALLER